MALLEHRTLGLRVGCERALPGLTGADGPTAAGPVDVVVRLHERDLGDLPTPPDGVPVGTRGGERRWRTADGALVLRYDVAPLAWALTVDAGGRSVTVERTTDVDLDDVLSVVTTTGLAAAMLQRGVPVLHASAVDVGPGAVLVVGESGAGKSTTAAALVARGGALVADDTSALSRADGVVSVQPGPARLRLHPDSAALVGWESRETEPLFATPALGAKRFRAVREVDGTYCPRPRPVLAVYALEPRTAGAPYVADVPPAERLGQVLRHTFGRHLLDREHEARLWPELVAVAAAVPVLRVGLGEDLGRGVEHLVADARERAR